MPAACVWPHGFGRPLALLTSTTILAHWFAFAEQLIEVIFFPLVQIQKKQRSLTLGLVCWGSYNFLHHVCLCNVTVNWIKVEHLENLELCEIIICIFSILFYGLNSLSTLKVILNCRPKTKMSSSWLLGHGDSSVSWVVWLFFWLCSLLSGHEG